MIGSNGVSGQTHNNLAEVTKEHKKLRRSLSMKEIIAVVIHCQFKLLRPFATAHQKLSRAQVRIIAVDHAVNKVSQKENAHT